ncbi:MAG: Na+-transporting NADH:ubiquinone oxidoreductase, subunit NqrB [Chitinophagaceae bacterium]|nr:MAG: Na+-transporting NADH:ubiquinone oxidoreductase, subunit NqrB [Chitinophagaceae bacterium]
MRKLPAPDPRLFQAGFQLFFLTFGLLVLQWDIGPQHIAASVGGCLLFQYGFECIRQARWIAPVREFRHWGFSVLISALSLCLLLRTNSWHSSLLAAAFSVGSKYLFRFRGQHLFNPSAFGIVATLLLTNDAWLSPGQWGSGTLLFFLILTLGTIVVTRVQQLDVSLAFLAGYAGLMAWRQLWVLGWPPDHFVHTLCTGSLLLFTFFMISDPRTAPAHPLARIAWGFGVGALAFCLAAFKWWYNTPLTVLVLAAPLVPLLNHLLPRQRFAWKGSPLPLPSFIKTKKHAAHL